MSKIDDVISSLREDQAFAMKKHDTEVTVDVLDLGTLVLWAVRVREKNPILVGDRVLLKVYEDEEGPQPTEGVVTAFTSGGVIVDAGDLGSTLWYPVTGVTRVED